MHPQCWSAETNGSSTPSFDPTHAVQKHRRCVGLREEGLIVGFGPTQGVQQQNFIFPPRGSQAVGGAKCDAFPIDGPDRFTVLFQAHGTGVGARIIGGMGQFQVADPALGGSVPKCR